MHRYGLVYLWHNKELQNQNRSVTKERRDGQAPSPPRSKNRNNKRPQYLQHKHTTSVQPQPQQQNHIKMDDATVLAAGEIRRVKSEIQMIARRVEKSAIHVAEAQRKLSEMQAGLQKLAGGDCRSEEAYKNLLQLAVKESERRQKERLMALSELQTKEQLLASLTNQNSSM